jgi:hypothetical protein
MNENIDKTISDKTGFITKASTKYCDNFFLRAAIQRIPSIGGSLDMLLSGLGAKYQYERLEGFVSDLQDKFKKLEQINNISNMKPSEELFDLMMQIFDQVIKTRSQEKRERFANLVANQVINKCDWDEVEIACRLLGDLTDAHIAVLEVSIKVPPTYLENQRVVTLAEKHLHKRQKYREPPHLQKLLPNLSVSALRMICSELISKGLLHDTGLGRWGGVQALTYLVATDMAKWFMNWISEPKINSKPEHLSPDK